MSNFSIIPGKFGQFNTIKLKNNSNGEIVEIALQGATLLKYIVPLHNTFFNIIDGFSSPVELAAAKGARSWIMTPFANRIDNGSFTFESAVYKLEPIPPRDRVIHGFTSYHNFTVAQSEVTAAQAVLVLAASIRPGQYQGFPFSFDVLISFTLTLNKLSINVSAENTGSANAPFFSGWHPYFKTNNSGIQDLILTVNASQVILLDENSIPLPGEKAYAPISDYPHLDFNSDIPEEKRRIGNRTLDHCYAGIKQDNDGFSSCSIFDPENGLKVEMFQQGGYTLAFSGDSLAQRARRSVALEPMQFITNAFNRQEFQNAVSVAPGEKSSFSFGVNTFLQPG